MKLYKFFVFFLLLQFLNYFSYSQQLTSTWNSKIVKMDLKYSFPMDLLILEKNRFETMPEDVALLDTTYDLEARIYLTPKINGEPDSLTNFKMKFQQFAEKICDGRRGKVSMFNPKAVKKDYNAVYGASMMNFPSKSFSKKYRYALILGVLHPNKGHFFIVFLMKDETNFEKKISKLFYSLKFNSL